MLFRSVQRNKGIDGFLKEYYKDSPVAIRIQKRDEDLNTAMKLMKNAGKKKGCKLMILVKTINIENNQEPLDISNEVAATNDNEKIIIIESYNTQIKNLINNQN